MISSDSVLCLRAELLAADVQGDTIVMNVDRGLFFGFNPIGDRVWRRLKEPVRVADLCEELARDYEAPPGVLEADVIRFLDELVRNGFVDVRA